jgi:hypothetical protein
MTARREFVGGAKGSVAMQSRHVLKWIACTAVYLLLASSSEAQQAPVQTTINRDDAIERTVRAESAIAARMRGFHPIVEVYIQNLAASEQLGTIPVKDEYFLGQFDWAEGQGPRLEPMSQEKGALRQSAGVLSHPFGVQYLPDGFAAMALPDWRLLEAQRYDFQFVKREFLGEVRCFVFDVMPRAGTQDGFTGRIWVEDRDFNIVRFNGINRSVDTTLSSFFKHRLSFHVDGWRVNVLPGVWLPSYVYCEETDTSEQPKLPRVPKIKAQVRIWGYQFKRALAPQQLTTIEVESSAVRDSATPGKQLSPVLSQRRWEQEAEDNVIDRLTKGGLLAPVGDVDQVLSAVVNNLQVTNNLSIDAEVHCRVLLTAPFESFTIGHTIVLSRGLLDVLPDEASLAMMLAHELGHIVLGHQLIDTKFAFADRMMVSDFELLRTLHFRHTPKEEAAADAKVAELLRNSPYKDKLTAAGLFLRAVGANAKQLSNLIQPHMGELLADDGGVLRMTELMTKAPALAPERVDQIAALPLGARLVVDPWSGHAEFVRSAGVALVSAREKVPFAVTPLMPYLRYAQLPASAPAAAQSTEHAVEKSQVRSTTSDAAPAPGAAVESGTEQIHLEIPTSAP